MQQKTLEDVIQFFDAKNNAVDPRQLEEDFQKDMLSQYEWAKGQPGRDKATADWKYDQLPWYERLGDVLKAAGVSAGKELITDVIRVLGAPEIGGGGAAMPTFYPTSTPEVSTSQVQNMQAAQQGMEQAVQDYAGESFARHPLATWLGEMAGQLPTAIATMAAPEAAISSPLEQVAGSSLGLVGKGLAETGLHAAAGAVGGGIYGTMNNPTDPVAILKSAGEWGIMSGVFGGGYAGYKGWKEAKLLNTLGDAGEAIVKDLDGVQGHLNDISRTLKGESFPEYQPSFKGAYRGNRPRLNEYSERPTLPNNGSTYNEVPGQMSMQYEMPPEQVPLSEQPILPRQYAGQGELQFPVVEHPLTYRENPTAGSTFENMPGQQKMGYTFGEPGSILRKVTEEPWVQAARKVGLMSDKVPTYNAPTNIYNIIAASQDAAEGMVEQMKRDGILPDTTPVKKITSPQQQQLDFSGPDQMQLNFHTQEPVISPEVTSNIQRVLEQIKSIQNKSPLEELPTESVTGIMPEQATPRAPTGFNIYDIIRKSQEDAMNTVKGKKTPVMPEQTTPTQGELPFAEGNTIPTMQRTLPEGVSATDTLTNNTKMYWTVEGLRKDAAKWAEIAKNKAKGKNVGYSTATISGKIAYFTRQYTDVMGRVQSHITSAMPEMGDAILNNAASSLGLSAENWAEITNVHGGPRLSEEQKQRIVQAYGTVMDESWNHIFPVQDSEGAAFTATTGRYLKGQQVYRDMVAQFKLKPYRKYMVTLSQTEKEAFQDAIETGRPQANAQLQHIADTLGYEPYRQLLKELDPLQFENLQEQYMGSLWKPKSGAETKPVGGGKYSLQGKPTALKPKVFDTAKEARAAGYEPVFDNPIDTVLFKQRELSRYIFGKSTFDALKNRNIIQLFAYKDVKPADMFKIKDSAARVLGGEKVDTTLGENLTNIINGIKDMSSQGLKLHAAVLRLKSQITTAMGDILDTPIKDFSKEQLAQLRKLGMGPLADAKLVKKMLKSYRMNDISGEYYAPKDVARIYNNWLSPGLEHAKAYQLMRNSSNFLNQAQLGLSAFHAVFTGIDLVTSTVALGIQKVLTGESGGLKDIASVLNPVGTVAREYKVGRAIKEAYYNPSAHPEYAPVVDAMKAANFRPSQPEMYIGKFIDSFWDKWNTGDKMGVAKTALPALMEWASSPIMEHLVPNLKNAAFYKLMETELRRGGSPDVGTHAYQRIVQKVGDIIDNRLGQMNYENLHMNKIASDLAFLVARAPGWNIGSARSVGGFLGDTAHGIFDIVKNVQEKGLGEGLSKDSLRQLVTPNTVYVPTLLAVVGAYGGALQFLMTHKPPTSLLDLYFPQSGGVDNYGIPNRASIPSYVKDLYAFFENPVQTVEHKINPLFALMGELWHNADYYDAMIRQEGDPKLKQLYQMGAHIVKAILPFSIKNMFASISKGESPLKTTMAFGGFNTAPRNILRSTALNLAMEQAKGNMPKHLRTSEQVQRIGVEIRLRNKYLDGTLSSGELDDALSQGLIRPNDVKKIQSPVKSNPFVNLLKGQSMEQVVNVWDVATDSEQQDLKKTIISKFENTKGNMTPEERERYKIIVQGIREQ